MPISRERKALYPKNWREIALRVKEEAGWRCEWCGARHGEPHPVTGSKVVLTVHHIDGDARNNARSNLVALCQKCHLEADREMHILHARETRILRKIKVLREHGQMELFK